MLDTTINDTSSIEARVAVLGERVKGVQEDVADLKTSQANQTGKLDLLVADMNKRAGEERVRGRLGKLGVAIFTGTGFIGWLWEHLHK